MAALCTMKFKLIYSRLKRYLNLKNDLVDCNSPNLIEL